MTNKMKLRDENGKIYFGWYILIVSALIGTLIYNGIISTSGVFMLPVTTELGIPVGAFSFYISILSVANIITLYIISRKLNKNNIKKIMIITGTLGVLSFVGFSFSTQIWHFYALAVLQGICFGACTMTPCTILVSNWFGPKVRGKAMSFYIAGISLIGMGVINILNMIIMRSGWRGGYLFCAAGILICLPLMAKFAVWSPADKGVARMGDAEEAVEAGPVDPNAIPGYTAKEGLRKPAVWVALISCVLLVLASSSMLQHGIPTFIMAGKSPTIATFISSLISVIMIGTNLIVGWAIDKFGVRFGAVATCAFFALGTLGYAMVADMPGLMYPSIILYAFGVPAVNTVSPLIMAYICGEKEIHKFISYMNMLIAVGGIFGAAIVGTMFDVTGGYKVPWLVMAGILVIASIMRAVATSRKNKYAA
ncbi:MFS transporter [Anaerovorax odorimutans]|uniref:MFS transporter n=1 Tax=Anaerovorax odorimutans TaxID=109327 RepID=A0ABT1RNG4_9FIRM|nr:MFS transporter [Anaerovorax odorimutans]MCQ4636727.1 MFS transporter [Anaerovorax odorimutans]